MKRRILVSSVGAILGLGLITTACMKKKSAAPAASAAKTSNALTCGSSSLEAMQSTPTNLALTDLSVQPEGIIVSNDSASSNTGVNSIRIDSKKLRNTKADSSPMFMRWKACSSDNKDCLNDGQWTKHYGFEASYIPLLRGKNNLSAQVCVGSLDDLSPDARKTAVNSCDSAGPCYCGSPVQTNYDNSNDPSQLNGDVKTAVDKLHDAKKKMFKLAEDYRMQAKNYVSQCADRAKGSTGLQYAKNVLSQPASNIALGGELLAAQMRGMIRETQADAKTGLALAEDPTICSAGTSDTTGSDNSSSYADNSGAGPTSTNDDSDTTGSSGGGSSSGGSSSTSVETASSSTSTNTYIATQTLTEPGKPTDTISGLYGVGIPLLAAGAYMVIHGITIKATGGRTPLAVVKDFWKSSGQKLNLAVRVKDAYAEKMYGDDAHAKAKARSFDLEMGQKLDEFRNSELERSTHLDSVDIGRRMSASIDTPVGSVEEATPSSKAVPAAETAKAAKPTSKAANAKYWGVAGLVAALFGGVMIGTAGTLGAGLADSCGDFMVTANTMESQILTQQKAIQDAMLAVSDAIIKAK